MTLHSDTHNTQCYVRTGNTKPTEFIAPITFFIFGYNKYSQIKMEPEIILRRIRVIVSVVGIVDAAACSSCCDGSGEPFLISYYQCTIVLIVDATMCR
jgi:hypothetical protein